MPLNKNDERFKIEHQYQLYLKRVALREQDMHPEQKIQTRQAFYGACGQMLILLRDDVAELSENDGVQVLDRMLKEMEKYWVERVSGKS